MIHRTPFKIVSIVLVSSVCFHLLPLNCLALLTEPSSQDISSNSVGGLASLDPVLGLRRTDHVVVEVESDSVSFLLCELLSIVVGSSKTAPVSQVSRQ
jgi:hypothetical protein